MHILSIATFLPVPGDETRNDVVLYQHRKHLEQHPEDRFTLLYPSVLPPPFFAGLFGKKFNQHVFINKKGYYSVQDFDVYLLKFWTIRRFFPIHSTLSVSSVLRNKTFIDDFVKKNKFDLVACHNIFPDGWIASYIKRKYGIPYTMNVRQIDFVSNVFCKYLSLKVLRLAAQVSCINYPMHNILLKNNVHSEFIPHGVEPRFLNTSRKSFSPKVVLRILTISRLIKQKNIDITLQAISKLQDMDFHYTIVGSGPEENRLKILVEELSLKEKVTFTGPVKYEDVCQILSKHDVFILNGNGEAFGRVYIEAIAMGLPVIFSYGSGIDGFIEDGDCGFRVHPRNIEEIASKIKRLYDSPKLRLEMGLRGHKKMQSYTWENVIKKYSNMYKLAMLENK